MKFIVSMLLTALLSFALCLYLPWWTIAPAAALVAFLIPQKPGRSFLCGFLALFLLWGGLSIFISLQNDHILANKVSLLLFKLKNPYVLAGITAFIGALVGGLSALAGTYARLSPKQA